MAEEVTENVYGKLAEGRNVGPSEVRAPAELLRWPLFLVI